jgi:hypothetical protein
VSSNNGGVTSDQAFITLTLQAPTAQTPEVPYAIILPIGALFVMAGGYVVMRRRQSRTVSAQA